MADFCYNGSDLEVTEEMKATFEKDGFVVVKNLFSKQEFDILEVSTMFISKD